MNNNNRRNHDLQSEMITSHPLYIALKRKYEKVVKQKDEFKDLCGKMATTIRDLKSKNDALNILKSSYVVHPYLIVPKRVIELMDEDEQFKNASKLLDGDVIFTTIAWESREDVMYNSMSLFPHALEPVVGLLETTTFESIFSKTIPRYHQHYFWIDDPLIATKFTQGVYCYDDNNTPVLRLCRSDSDQFRNCRTLKDAMEYLNKDLASLQTSLWAFDNGRKEDGPSLLPFSYLASIYKEQVSFEYHPLDHMSSFPKTVDAWVVGAVELVRKQQSSQNRRTFADERFVFDEVFGGSEDYMAYDTPATDGDLQSPSLPSYMDQQNGMQNQSYTNYVADHTQTDPNFLHTYFTGHQPTFSTKFTTEPNVRLISEHVPTFAEPLVKSMLPSGWWPLEINRS